MKSFLLKIIFLFGFCCNLTVFADAPAVAPFPSAAEQLQQQAEQALRAGNTDQAVSLLEEGMKLFVQTFADEKRKIYAAQNRVEALNYLLEAAMQKQDAVVVDARWAGFFYLRAYARIERQELAAAKEDLDRALQLSPINPIFLNERGNLFLMQKDWDRAGADFQKAVDNNLMDNGALRDATLARSKRGLAYILIERGQLDAAEAVYRTLLQENPDDRAAQNQLQYIEQQRTR